MTRPTNEDLCTAFRSMLTSDAKQMLPEDVLEVTKPWRAALWEAFKEIDARMCPRPPRKD